MLQSFAGPSYIGAFIPREVIAQFAKQEYAGGPPMSGMQGTDPTPGERALHAFKGMAPYSIQPMFDPSFTMEEAVKKGGLGLMGANIYGRDADQKDRDRAAKREKRRRKLEEARQ